MQTSYALDVMINKQAVNRVNLTDQNLEEEKKQIGVFADDFRA